MLSRVNEITVHSVGREFCYEYIFRELSYTTHVVLPINENDRSFCDIVSKIFYFLAVFVGLPLAPCFKLLLRQYRKQQIQSRLNVVDLRHGSYIRLKLSTHLNRPNSDFLLESDDVLAIKIIYVSLFRGFVGNRLNSRKVSWRSNEHVWVRNYIGYTRAICAVWLESSAYMYAENGLVSQHVARDDLRDRCRCRSTPFSCGGHKRGRNSPPLHPFFSGATALGGACWCEYGVDQPEWQLPKRIMSQGTQVELLVADQSTPIAGVFSNVGRGLEDRECD